MAESVSPAALAAVRDTASTHQNVVPLGNSIRSVVCDKGGIPISGVTYTVSFGPIGDACAMAANKSMEIATPKKSNHSLVEEFILDTTAEQLLDEDDDASISGSLLVHEGRDWNAPSRALLLGGIPQHGASARFGINGVFDAADFSNEESGTFEYTRRRQGTLKSKVVLRWKDGYWMVCVLQDDYDVVGNAIARFLCPEPCAPEHALEQDWELSVVRQPDTSTATGASEDAVPVQAWEPIDAVQVLATTGVMDVEVRGNVDYIVGKYERMGHHWSQRRPVYKLDRNLVAKSTLYSDYYLHWRDGKWMITYLAGRGAGFLGVDELASDNAQVMAYFACTARACPDVIHGGRQHWMSEYLAPHDTSDAGVGLRRSVSVASTPRASPTASDGAASAGSSGAAVSLLSSPSAFFKNLVDGTGSASLPRTPVALPSVVLLPASTLRKDNEQAEMVHGTPESKCLLM